MAASWIADRARPLFCGDASASEAAPDHLVRLVRFDPAAGARLIETLTLFSGAGNMAVFVACTAFLGAYWPQCGSCSRPLRWWLLAQAVLQLGQLPVRVALVALVRGARGEDAEARDLPEQLASLTSSKAWKMSKTVAMVQYGWFVLGVVWWMHSTTCPGCPGIGKLIASVMLLTVARAAVAMTAFQVLFPQGAEPQGDVDQPKKVASATVEQIASLPVVRFSTCCSSEFVRGGGDPESSCSICLSDYDEGCQLRRLPCGHDFHRRCVDKWLQRNKHCPLCVQAVDMPTPKSGQCSSKCHFKAD